MRKADFSEFKVGTVFNGIEVHGDPKLKYQNLTVCYPSRLEAMALDPSKIVDNNNLIYEAGQINFCVSLHKYITVEVKQSSSEIVISDRTSRKSLVMHAALLMQKAVGFTHGLTIDVKDEIDLRHCGLGSSSSLIAGTAAAINELYERPIALLDLVRYCAQNHGEEIDNSDDKLIPVQCIGGSGVCGHFEGGLIILAGQAAPIYRAHIPADTKVVIGIPVDFDHPDSQTVMGAEVDNLEGFKKAGDQYGKDIAYRLVHEVMPGLAENNLKPCKDLIFDYRWDMGSIENCSFVYPSLLTIAEQLRPLKDDQKVDIIALSSVGPGFFALTKDIGHVEDIFVTCGLKTIVTTISNGKYSVQING
jgi:predicted sugar kinase